jgi:hypothetical protein|tara:strand:- start:1551 stop:2240 length:690 start_codon:yes stop_codon:yes gene_type:complete
MSKLLNSGNYKTSKGEKYGWKTYGLHLAPFNISGKNVCASASAGCSAACLNTAGRGVMHSVQDARVKKTRRFFEDRDGFLSQLYKEIKSSVKSAAKKQINSCFRLNLTSDILWERFVIADFPESQFYDYTKHLKRFVRFLEGKLPSNYHLTYSRDETTPDTLVKSLCASGGNVAVVFRGKKLPRRWLGIEVIDGDDSDLRFQDGKGKIVGLLEKGLAKKDETGFVVEPC